MSVAKRTPERERVILQALAEGCSRKAACAIAGVSDRSFRKWMAGDDEWQTRVALAESKPEKKMLKVVFDAAQGGEWKAASWWLARRVGEYREKAELKQSIEVESKEVEATPQKAGEIMRRLFKGAGPAPIEPN